MRARPTERPRMTLTNVSWTRKYSNKRAAAVVAFAQRERCQNRFAAVVERLADQFSIFAAGILPVRNIKRAFIDQ